jgi:ligand-binding sensor domain-containing protein
MSGHWTDNATYKPIFKSVISARGSEGNIILILARACRMLEIIDIPQDRITKLKTDVRTAQNYDEAVALVERWFKVDRDE